MAEKKQDAEEIIVTNGGSSSAQALVQTETTKLERIVFAEDVQKPSAELIERYEGILDAYTAKLQERLEHNVQKAMEQGVQVEDAGLEIGEPIGGAYKWWDIYAIGPIQGFGVPPFRPNKIIAGREAAFFLVYVVTNPMLIGGVNPSATTLMAGRPYTLRLESINLTNVAPGPSVAVRSVFPGTPVQAFLLGFRAPNPLQGRPEVLDFSITADVTDNWRQPMAAFATNVLDVDFDPGFPIGRSSFLHLHNEQPLRCLCYRR